ncbi:MAG: tRNA pseudouridine(38-40) synthase TruA [Flavobacteriales bacterium]|nr:tRNA pseudouridine(38-40) synthase TruA [Flavobacteriales bacterium]
MKRYFLKLAYDGSNYSGWQIQPKVTTVQGTLEAALKILVKDFRALIGCGRTDTGVHAKEYFAHFDTELPLNEEFLYKLNAILPLDISVYECYEVDKQRHARFTAGYREYQYFMHFKKIPFKNAYSVYHVKQLDIDRLNEGSKHLLGKHDFTSFSKSNTQVKTNICRVQKAVWEPIDEGIVFTIGANRFLRNMVRAIVGTLLPIGEGLESPEYILKVIEKKDRSSAGKSAHPQGLFLNRIIYPD